MSKQILAEFKFGMNGLSDAGPLRGEPSALAPGSRNLMPDGLTELRPVKPSVLIAGKTAPRLLCAVKDTWGGLADVSAAQKGAGSLFAWLAEMLIFIGRGQVNLEGALVPGAFCSSNLKFLLKVNGSYQAAASGPFVAGMSQPAAPQIAAVTPAGGAAPVLEGTYSIKIARVRRTTGGRSRASATSATLDLTGGQAIEVTVPPAQAGQTGWVFFVTRKDFGGTGLHYRLARANPVTGTEYTETEVAQAANRKVVLNWTEADLLEETAWIEDFPPPAGSHAFALENVLGVIAYADSGADASADNPGSAIAFSLPNFPESFNPLHLLYLPEKAVAVLGRGMDSYVFIATRNQILAVQYLNSDGQSVPATLTVMIPDEGIKQPSNWCISGRGLYLFTEKSKAIRISEGGAIDRVFSAAVSRIMARWNPADVVVASAPGAGGAIYFHKQEALAFDETTNRWSSLLSVAEQTNSARVLSAIATRGETVFALEREIEPATNSTSAIYALDPYLFDRAENALQTVSAVGHYTNQPAAGRLKTVTEINAAFVSGKSATGQLLPVYLSIHRDNRPTVLRDGTTIAGTNKLSTAALAFDASDVGSYVLLFNENADLLLRRVIAVESAQILRLGTPEADLNESTPINFDAAKSGLYALLAHRIYRIEPQRAGAEEAKPLEPIVRGLSSFAVGITVSGRINDESLIQPLGAIVRGSISK